ncbi:MAG: hypothetical protein KBF17_03055 [Candidatus Promineofilum sp.]|nr:hypothetical protein [Promineifilum sp.]MBP9657063.1 hypothetical protein [Promineifilum sp.]
MKLMLLRCPKCNTALAPGQEDQVVQCPNCRAAVGIQEGGLDLPAVQYAASSVEEVASWLPFRVYRGRVTINQRKTQEGRSTEREARAFWDLPRRMYVPAWSVGLPQARDLIAKLVQTQPPLEEIAPPEGATFEPVVVSPEDGRKLLELVIVSIEAKRSDWIETLDFDLRLESEELWLLPAEQTAEGPQLLLKKP